MGIPRAHAKAPMKSIAALIATPLLLSSPVWTAFASTRVDSAPVLELAWKFDTGG